VGLIAPRLEARLRRQSRLITAGLAVGLPVGVAGVLLGIATIWSGWHSGAWHFVTRGFAIVVISVTTTFSLLSLRRGNSDVATRSLSKMIEFAVVRARRTRALVQTGLYLCAVTAAFGVAGTIIRSHLASLPRMSPILDLALLGLVAVVLSLKERQIKVEIEKFRALQNALSPM
jgi:hypothetical protein